MDQNLQWLEQFRKTPEYLRFKDRPIAYFCAEFALEEEMSTYAGGLGVLSGDIIREAIDQQIPLVAVGLYYHEGYLHHELYTEGIMLKHPMRRSPEEFGFHQVLDQNKQRLTVTIPVQGRTLHVAAWEKEIGLVRIFLLDTDISINEATDREITNRLYVGKKETRFEEEMVLGIGGLRLLQTLKIQPLIYHMNEGHSALLALEVAHHEMDKYNKSFSDELEYAKQHIVFTNHTLLTAGNDTFSIDLASVLLSEYSKELQIPISEIISFGQIQDSSVFSMTILALRMAGQANAVSKLHSKKAKDIWPDHPMLAITNGIHIKTWDKIKVSEVSNVSKVPKENISLASDTSGTSDTLDTFFMSFWQKHLENKRELLKIIQAKTGEVWSENELLIGWARRIVGYKRPLALFQNKEKLLHLLKDSKRPLKVVLAGSAHENDFEGAHLLEELQQMIVRDFNGSVVYLPEYNMKLAKVMTAGCDLWMNTPVVGFEACGTSGMKASLNGVLPLTTKDGWANEVELYGIGWILDSENITDSLLDVIERQIIPMYYYQDKQGVPRVWLENMKNAREMVLKEYSTTRMLREYIELMYLPALVSLQR